MCCCHAHVHVRVRVCCCHARVCCCHARVCRSHARVSCSHARVCCCFAQHTMRSLPSAWLYAQPLPESFANLASSRCPSRRSISVSEPRVSTRGRAAALRAAPRSAAACRRSASVIEPLVPAAPPPAAPPSPASPLAPSASSRSASAASILAEMSVFHGLSASASRPAQARSNRGGDAGR